MLKLITVAFGKKTYDYLCEENVDIGDTVLVRVHGDEIDKEVLDVNLVKPDLIENQPYEFKTAELLETGKKGLVDILTKDNLSKIKDVIKKYSPEEISYISAEMRNYKPSLNIYSDKYEILENVEDVELPELEEYQLYSLDGILGRSL